MLPCGSAVKNSSAMQELPVRPLGQEDPLDKEMKAQLREGLLQAHSCGPLFLTGCRTKSLSSSSLAIGQGPPSAPCHKDHSIGQLVAAFFIDVRVLGIRKTTTTFRDKLKALMRLTIYRHTSEMLWTWFTTIKCISQSSESH